MAANNFRHKIVYLFALIVLSAVLYAYYRSAVRDERNHHGVYAEGRVASITLSNNYSNKYCIVIYENTEILDFGLTLRNFSMQDYIYSDKCRKRIVDIVDNIVFGISIGGNQGDFKFKDSGEYCIWNNSHPSYFIRFKSPVGTVNQLRIKERSAAITVAEKNVGAPLIIRDKSRAPASGPADLWLLINKGGQVDAIPL